METKPSIGSVIDLVVSLPADDQIKVLKFLQLSIGGGEVVSKPEAEIEAAAKPKKLKKNVQARQSSITNALEQLGPGASLMQVVTDIRNRQGRPYELSKDDAEACKRVQRRMISSNTRFMECPSGGWMLISQVKAPTKPNNGSLETK